MAKRASEARRAERARRARVLKRNRMARELYDLQKPTWFGEFTAEDEARGRKLFNDWVDSLPEQERAEILAVEAAECFEEGICPECGGHLGHGSVVNMDDFVIEKDYGAGYYKVWDRP